MRTGREILKLRWWRFAACALIVVMVLPSTAAMAGLFEECTALFERGNQAYKRGDYPKAVCILLPPLCARGQRR